MSARRDLQRDFAEFASLLLEPSRLAEVAADADVEVDWLRSAAETSIAEARHTLRVIESRLDPSDQLLEVGSGLGVASSFLASCDFSITSLEPGGSGFEPYERVNPRLRASLGIVHPHHVVAVEDVCATPIGGPFDLIFSNNVLEHVDDVARTLTVLSESLSPQGVMVHHCPNYRVPYEPHFGVPLLPGRPAWTAKVLPERIGSSDLWGSLNFVNAGEVMRLAEEFGASVEFERGALADSFMRLREPEFGERHPVLRRFSVVVSVLDPVVRRIPASWATPMTFTWSQASSLVGER
jgi:SAM-dependent methyltransferase